MIGSTSLFLLICFLGNPKSITLLQTYEQREAKRKKKEGNKDKWRNLFVVFEKGIKRIENWQQGSARTNKNELKTTKKKCWETNTSVSKTQTKAQPRKT